MKLLVVTPEYLPTSGGGIVTYYRHLLPALVRAGAQVTVLVGSAMHQPGGEIERDGVRVIGLDPARFAARLPQFPQLAALPGLRRHVAAAWALHDQAVGLGGFDAIEAVDWGLSGLGWLLAADTPVLIRCHGSIGQVAMHERSVSTLAMDQLILAIERSLLGRASATASYGEDNARQWSAWLGRECAHREPALACPPPIERGDSQRCLVLARVQRWKGPQVLGAALESMGSPPSVRWVGRDVPDPQTGNPSTLAALRREHPRAWGALIERCDTVDAVLAQQWLGEARAVLVPSTWDVFNFAGAEAMAAGAVVVASAGAGMSAWIAHGENGWRVPAGDAAALADALLGAMAMDPAARRRMGEAARCTAAERADPECRAAAELLAYRALRAPVRREDPLDALLRPGSGSDTIDGVLEQYALRDLLSHSLRRIGRRLANR